MGAREDILAIPDELLRDGSIAEAVLVWMDFATLAKRWWAGFGPLEHAGHIWEGVGDLISIDNLVTDYQMSAFPVSFSLAATSDMLTLVRNSKTAVTGRQVMVYSQLFATTPLNIVDETGDPLVSAGPWQPLGQPMPLFVGTMGPMTYSMDSPVNCQITLQCEGFFARRNAPPRGLWTDADQKARHPGDKGLERVGIYTDYETRWI